MARDDSRPATRRHLFVMQVRYISNMLRLFLVLLLLIPVAPEVGAQDSKPETATTSALPRPAWISRKDIKPIGIALASVTLLSLSDEIVARSALKPTLQNNRSVNHAADAIQMVGDPGVAVISASLYVAGRLSGSAGLADASRHAVESLVLSAALTHALKFGVGRARPSLSDGQSAFDFRPFRGTHEFNSLPSGHTSAAFAAAGVFGSEIARRHLRTGRVVRPLFYGVATLVAGARVYNNRHWLSDVAMGALIGEFTARRVERRAHEHH